jgi:hypothetical protein
MSKIIGSFLGGSISGSLSTYLCARFLTEPITVEYKPKVSAAGAFGGCGETYYKVSLVEHKSEIFYDTVKLNYKNLGTETHRYIFRVYPDINNTYLGEEAE